MKRVDDQQHATPESSQGSMGFRCQGCGEPMPSVAVHGAIPAGFNGCPKCGGCSWVGTFMVGGSPRQAEEGVPIDTLDWNRLRSGDRRALNPENQPLFDRFFAQSESAPILPPTHDEIAAYRDLFRTELDKNMNNHSGSPSTDAHTVALHAFVAARNKEGK